METPLHAFPGIRDFSDAIGSARLVGTGLNRLQKTSWSTSIISQCIFEGRRSNSDTLKKIEKEIQKYELTLLHFISLLL